MHLTHPERKDTRHMTPTIPSGRIHSIDALRGFDMFWIIGGGTVIERIFALTGFSFFLTLNGQFEHSEWNGFTFEDLIFPLFLFIVGLSIPLSLSKRLALGGSKRGVVLHILQRAATLLVLGLIFNGILNLNIGNMRWMGVLQRIAICYFAAALIYSFTGLRGRIIWTAGILLGYWLVMALVPVPGFGSGVITPDGNFASFIDRTFLPGRFCCFKSGDNEGLLSTIPAISTCLMGVLCSDWLRSGRSGKQTVLGMAAAGVASIAAALLWGIVFPINKLIWTSTFVLYAGGWSLLIFAAFYWIIDVRGWQKWAFFFIVIGLNPITIYVGQEIINFGTIANYFIRGISAHAGDFRQLVVAVGTLGAKWFFLWVLFRQKLFLKA
jgi:predicted acyltransferase